jgi:hypothetical protein
VLTPSSPVDHSGQSDDRLLPFTFPPVLRGYAETLYQARSWAKAWRACARIEATTLGLDIRYVVTSLAIGSKADIARK